jgi:prefoldin subunit 5
MTVGEIDNAIKSLRKRKEELENPKEHGTPVQTGSNNLAF